MKFFNLYNSDTSCTVLRATNCFVFSNLMKLSRIWFDLIKSSLNMPNSSTNCLASAVSFRVILLIFKNSIIFQKVLFYFLLVDNFEKKGFNPIKRFWTSYTVSCTSATLQQTKDSQAYLRDVLSCNYIVFEINRIYSMISKFFIYIVNPTSTEFSFPF